MNSIIRDAFRRPKFNPLPSAHSEDGNDSIVSLPDLIKFNAQHNPQHLFCFQAGTKVSNAAPASKDSWSYSASRLTFNDLEKAVRSCARWIDESVEVQNTEKGTDNPEETVSPVALYLESDIGLFIHIAALLTLNIPVLLLSARLSSEAVRHLLVQTKAAVLLVSARTRPVLRNKVDDVVKVMMAKPYDAYITALETRETYDDQLGHHQIQRRAPGDLGAIILHSSGTTGLPKPISVTHRYPLRFAACHRISEDQMNDWANVSTLPLYHGFGLLAPCLSLSIGMSCIFPPTSVIPAGQATLQMIRTFKAKSLMTVPSVVEDLLALSKVEQDGAFETLSTLEFLAVGGGALNPEHGATLANNGVKFLNHYGVTEIGAIATIFCPTSEYDWRYLRLRDDLGLQLQAVENSPRWKLSGPAASETGVFEIQDELERRQESKPGHIEVRILGRKDDVIVLKTGEKVRPQQLEDELHKDPAIKTAVCVGSGYFEVAVLVEPFDADTESDSVRNNVWERISSINEMLDAHARISSRHAIIIKPTDKPIPRSDKGSVLRKSVHDDFKDEIEAAYEKIESDAAGANFDATLFRNDTRKVIHEMVASVAGNRLIAENIHDDDDLFELGMDSLQAVRLVRLISGALGEIGSSAGKLKAEFVYRHPSISELATAVSALLGNLGEEGNTGSSSAAGRGADMMHLVKEVSAEISQAPRTRPEVSMVTSHIVLLTGSTGNLGAHTLARLVRCKSVAKVVCFCRTGTSPCEDRQRRALALAGIDLSENEWSKVELLDSLEVLQKPAMKENKGKIGIILGRLASEITHILHLAWPVDFQRTLSSFRPHVSTVQHLIELARRAHAVRPSIRVRLMFSSSIAVIRNSTERASLGTVPETSMQDPLVTVPMGYAEAKWVCEQVLYEAGQEYDQEFEPVIVRVGQISGPQNTSGIWKAGEHMPTLLRISQKIGALPDLQGSISWLPVDQAAQCLTEMMLHENRLPHFLHLENPIRRPVREVLTAWGREISLRHTDTVSFDEWLEKASRADELGSLESFFRDDFRKLAHGEIILETIMARSISMTLRETREIKTGLLQEYVRRWRKDGVLK